MCGRLFLQRYGASRCRVVSGCRYLAWSKADDLAAKNATAEPVSPTAWDYRWMLLSATESALVTEGQTAGTSYGPHVVMAKLTSQWLVHHVPVFQISRHHSHHACTHWLEVKWLRARYQWETRLDTPEYQCDHDGGYLPVQLRKTWLGLCGCRKWERVFLWKAVERRGLAGRE